MLKLLKLMLLVIGVVIFFYLTGYIYYNRLLLHSLIFAVVVLIHTIRFSWKETWKMILLLLPFTITIFIFGLIFQVVNLMGRTDWLNDSLIKVVYFPASFLFTKFMISLFSYQDILDLPVRNELKADIIFLQVFIKKAFGIMPRLNFYINQHPLMKMQKSFKKKALFLCSFPLSLYIYLVEEGTMIREIYLNRQKHLGGI